MKIIISMLLLLLVVVSGCIYLPAAPATSTAATVTNTASTGTETAVSSTGNPPDIIKFATSVDTVAPGGRAQLSWDVTGAVQITIDNGEGPVAASGSRWVIPASTTTYTMNATNDYGYTVATIRVNVSGTTPEANLPVISSFAASPATVSAGGVSTLSWYVSNASAVSISPYIGSVYPIDGSGEITMGNTTTTFILTAVNAAGSVSSSTTVTVSGSSPQASWPWINSFSAKPAAIQPGASTTLYWNVGGAEKVTISDLGTVEAAGSRVISPAATTEYILTATTSDGNWTKQSVTIQVGQTLLTGSQSVVLPLIAIESGSLVKNNNTYKKSSAVCAGDTTLNLPSRAFLSFDISSIPANAIIEEAVLDLGNYAISGNPVYTVSGYGNMGALEVYEHQYGPSADMGTLGYNFPSTMVGSFKMSDTSGSPQSLDVTLDSAGNNVIGQLLSNGQARSQFRLQFFTTTNWDGIADEVCMESAILRVKYSIPW